MSMQWQDTTQAEHALQHHERFTSFCLASPVPCHGVTVQSTDNCVHLVLTEQLADINDAQVTRHCIEKRVLLFEAP